MPRTLDPVLEMALDRANPTVCHFVEVNAPDVQKVLRRAADQFLLAPSLVSQTPGGSIAADPTGALTMTSTPTTLASFTVADAAGLAEVIQAPALSQILRGLAWQPDLAFTRAVLRSFSARIKRRATNITNDLHLQIYRMEGHGVTGPGGGAPGGYVRTPTPMLAQPVLWKNEQSKWPGALGVSTTDTIVEFDLQPMHFEVGNFNRPAPAFELRGDESWYYFVIEPVNGRSDDNPFTWWRDQTTSRTVAGVGIFEDRFWIRLHPDDPFDWVLDPLITPAVPYATIKVDSYVASAQAVYSLPMSATPQTASVGRIVFERGVPVGTAATFELSTAGTGGPWTAVTHGTIVTTKQTTYHGRVTLTSDAAHRVAPRVAAFGLEFKIPIDVTAEAIVEPIAQEIDVPFLRSSIGEGRVSVVRDGRRDYRDVASELASEYSSSKLEVDVWLGSRHPLVTRDTWFHVDRAFVNNRDPSATAEQFGLLSYLKMLKRKVPSRAEEINAVRTVSAATPTQVTITGTLPGSGSYNGLGYYMRVRKSSQVGVGDGYQQTIDGSTSTNKLDFSVAMPGTLVAGDTIEIHSASYLQQGLTWVNADPATIWYELHTVHLLIPEERLGRGDLGRVARSGLPPTVADRAPGDTATQAKLKVTLKTQGPEFADELIAQVSFLMGGVTVDIGGQIVYRQIYPIRDATGQIVVAPEPIAHTFDVRNTTALSTPTGLEQRSAQLACDFGVNTTAVSKDTPPADTVNYVDVDALAWLDDQPFDELAPAAIPAEIARWCYNSADAGEYLASLLAQQVVRATSTGLRPWTWTATEAQPHLVVGDRVAVITDQYTDYDPARRMAIRGWWAYTLCLIAVQGGGTRFRGFMLGLSDAIQIRGGPGTLAPSDVTGPVTMRVEVVTTTDTTLVVDVHVADARPNGEPIIITTASEGGASVLPTTDTLTPPGDDITADIMTTAAATFTITKPLSGTPQGRVTFVATNSRGLSATASIDVVSAGAGAGLGMRLQRNSSDDGSVEYRVYVADVAPDPQTAIVVRAKGQGVAAVVAEDGSQTAVIGSRGNLVQSPRDVTVAPWAIGAGATISFDAAVAAPDGTLGVSKVVCGASGHYVVQPTIASGDFNGVQLTVAVWLKALAPMAVQYGVLRQDNAASVAFGTASVTTAWQRFEFTGPGLTATTAINYFLQAASIAGTFYFWEAVAVRGTIADVTDDLDTTDFVKFRVTRPAKQVTVTNLCLQSEDLGSAPWTSIGSISLGAPSVVDGITYDIVVETDAAVAGLWVQPIEFSADGVASVSLHVRQGTAVSSVIELFDTTATAARLRAVLTWVGGLPVLTMVAGASLDYVEKEGDSFRLLFTTTAVVAANNHDLNLYPASNAAGLVTLTGYLYMGGVQVERGAVPSPYVRTTDRIVTMTVDSPSGLVSFTATRNGKAGTSQAVTVEPSGIVANPLPQITVEAEGTSRDGNYQGQVRLLIAFDERTDSVDIFSSESAASGGAFPYSEDDYSGTVIRREGVIASDDNWRTEFDIGTHTGLYRQITAYVKPVQGIGQRMTLSVPRFVPPVFLEAQAIDTGTAPTAPPSAVVVTMSTVSGVPRADVSWTAGDALAEHRVFRNKIMLIRVAAGETAIVDDGLAPDTVYTYDVQAVRNGQTSEFASGLGGGGGTGGTSDTPTLTAPSFATGYPFGGSALFGDNPFVNVRVSNPNPGADTQVWMSPTSADSGTFTQVAALGPGVTDTTLLADSFGLSSGDSRYFYLVATRTGYTDSSASAHASATFRPDA